MGNVWCSDDGTKEHKGQAPTQAKHLAITEDRKKQVLTRANYLAMAKERAIANLPDRKAAAASFLNDIDNSQGKPYELYSKGSIAYLCVMPPTLFNKSFINDFN